MPKPTKSLAGKVTGTLEQHLLKECNAMAKYVLDAGIQISADLLQELHNLEIKLVRQKQSAASEIDQQTSDTVQTPANIDIDSIKRLGKIHNSLSKTVAPAKPGALLLLANEAADGGFKLILGPIPLIRQMMMVAILSLAGLILVSLSPLVDGAQSSFSLLDNNGYSLFLNEMFLLTAAAVGASFFALFQANRYIKDGTYDQRYEASYWIRFVLGLMAGTIMATLIPFEGASNTFGQPLLAMLGGFSASVVYRILNRLVSAVESLVRNDIRDQMATLEQEGKVRLQAQNLEQRAQLAAKVQLLQNKFKQTENSEGLMIELTRLQRELFSNDSFLEDKVTEHITETNSESQK